MPTTSRSAPRAFGAQAFPARRCGGRGGSAAARRRRRCGPARAAAAGPGGGGAVPMGHRMQGRAPDAVSRLQFPDNLGPGAAGGQYENAVRASGSSPVMTQTFGDGVDVTNVSRYPPPDLASILLHKRIVFLGEELVNDVVELIIAEFFYLAGVNSKSPIQMYIASTGTTRADGEVVALETNGTAIYDCMNYVKPDVYTANVGVAAGQAAMLLAAGKKGKRYAFPNSTTLLQQPRTPLTGQLQAIELDIRWKEMESQMLTYYEILSKHTGHSIEKLKHDLYYPLYMSPADAVEYGIIDNVRGCPAPFPSARRLRARARTVR